jgi:hypothetical protein
MGFKNELRAIQRQGGGKGGVWTKEKSFAAMLATKDWFFYQMP